MSSGTGRRKIGVGLLGAGIVGEAIQDSLLEDRHGKIGEDLELDLRKVYTRHPNTKKWFKHRQELFTSGMKLSHPPWKY